MPMVTDLFEMIVKIKSGNIRCFPLLKYAGNFSMISSFYNLLKLTCAWIAQFSVRATQVPWWSYVQDCMFITVFFIVELLSQAILLNI